MKYTSDSLKNVGRIVIDDGSGELTSDSNKLIGIFQIDDGTAKKTSDSPKVIGRVRVWDGSSPVIRTSDSDKLRGCVMIEDGKGVQTSDSRKVRGTVVLQGYAGGGGGGPTLSDSWDVSHMNGTDYLVDDSDQAAAGQAFTSQGGKLYSVKFWLGCRNGIPTGNVAAKLYAVIGTVGVDATATGTPLSVSDPLDASTIQQGNYGVAWPFEFLFTGASQYAMIAGTAYCIVLEGLTGFAANGGFIQMGSDYNGDVPPKHYGNLVYNQISYRGWDSDNEEDTIFELYTI